MLWDVRACAASYLQPEGSMAVSLLFWQPYKESGQRMWAHSAAGQVSCERDCSVVTSPLSCWLAGPHACCCGCAGCSLPAVCCVTHCTYNAQAQGPSTLATLKYPAMCRRLGGWGSAASRGSCAALLGCRAPPDGGKVSPFEQCLPIRKQGSAARANSAVILLSQAGLPEAVLAHCQSIRPWQLRSAAGTQSAARSRPGAPFLPEFAIPQQRSIFPVQESTQLVFP